MKKTRIAAFALAIAVVAAAAVYINGGADQNAPVSAEAGPALGAVLVIDAGHGGADGGAVSLGGALESDINLAIALRLEQVMALCGVKTVMTREDETIDYSENATTIRAKKVEDTKSRVALINSIPGAVVISIHQNTYPNAGPFGSQVLFASTAGSAELAEKMQKVLTSALTPDNRRAAAKIPGSVYIMNNINCPAILIECGFLSNPKEEALLRTGQYQLKVAATIAAGYLQHMKGQAG